MVARHPVDPVLGAADVEDVVPGLGEDLDDAGGHGAGPDDADERDVVPQLRLVVRRRGLVVGDHDRGVLALVGVEAAARLAPEHAGRDHLLQDRRGRVQAVAALAVHRLEDLVRRVETDQVEQGERAHRVAATETHGGVDVLPRGVVALVHGDRVVEVAEQQGVGDEAGLVAAHHGVLAELLDQPGHVLENLVLGDDRADDLDQVLHRRRVEEVDADDAPGPGVRGGDLGDRQRRGVGGEDRLRRDDVVELAEDVLLDLQRLDHGLDYEVGVREVLERGGERDLAQQLDLLDLGHLLPLDRPTGRVLEVLAPPLEGLVVLLHADHREAVAGEDLGDAGAHRAQADDADGAERALGIAGGAGHARHHSTAVSEP